MIALDRTVPIMAGDWIKMRKKLAKDGRVLLLSRSCHALRVTVIGALVTLWSLADDYAEENGLLPGYTPDDIDREVEIKNFCANMPPDWMRVENGKIYLPNYQEHNGDTAKKRAQATERQARRRTCHAPVTKMSRSVRDQRREEKRRIDNIPPTPQTGGVEFPVSLNTDQFKAAWERWETHRREIRHALKDTTRKSQLKKLAEWGEAKAIAAIEQSILHGWQGLFEPGANGKVTASDKLTEAIAERRAREHRENEERRRRDAESAVPPEVIKEKLRKAVPGLEGQR